jgi:hypothetical protein
VRLGCAAADASSPGAKGQGVGCGGGSSPGPVGGPAGESGPLAVVMGAQAQAAWEHVEPVPAAPAQPRHLPVISERTVTPSDAHAGEARAHSRRYGRHLDRQFDCLNCVPNGRFCAARLSWATDPGKIMKRSRCARLRAPARPSQDLSLRVGDPRNDRVDRPPPVPAPPAPAPVLPLVARVSGRTCDRASAFGRTAAAAAVR